MKYITEREKAAINYYLYAGVEDWSILYLIGSDRSTEDNMKDKYLSDKASNWKRSARIQEYLKTAIKRKALEEADREREIEKRARESERRQIDAEKGRSSFVDYSDPRNQIRKLNEIINEATDPGEALDAIKVVRAGQKDDQQAAREGKQVRAYLPQTCNNCILYQRAAKRMKNAKRNNIGYIITAEEGTPGGEN